MSWAWGGIRSWLRLPGAGPEAGAPPRWLWGASETRPRNPRLDGTGCPASLATTKMKKSLGAKALLYPVPVMMVGTYNPDGQPNMMTAGWGGIMCSRPPLVAVSLRKATFTYGNLVTRQAFTLSLPSENFAKEANYVGVASGRTVDKFAKTGLTPVRSDLVDAPYVKEFPMVLECRLVHTFDFGLHTQFIGEVVDLKVDAESVTSDGTLDIKRIKPLLLAPDAQAFFGVGEYVGPAFSIGNTV